VICQFCNGRGMARENATRMDSLRAGAEATTWCLFDCMLAAEAWLKENA